MKTACLIYATGSFHTKLAYCAFRSFKKWHPTIPLMGVKTDHINLDTELTESDQEMAMPVGIRKYAIGYRMMKEHNLDKLIMLGSDTITCSKLDEFLDDNKHDVLTTLDYPYHLVTPVYNGRNFKGLHVNADVVCFNNAEVLKLVVSRAHLHGCYFEQGALNEVCYVPTTPQIFSKIVDAGGENNTYEDSDVAYNVRSKGNIVADPMTQWEYTNKFIVRDSELLIPTPTLQTRSKQLKVWHYCEGFGDLDYTSQKERMDYWFSKGFNEDTKKFFKEHCDCGDFFDGEFTL